MVLTPYQNVAGVRYIDFYIILILISINSWKTQLVLLRTRMNFKFLRDDAPDDKNTTKIANRRWQLPPTQITSRQLTLSYPDRFCTQVTYHQLKLLFEAAGRANYLSACRKWDRGKMLPMPSNCRLVWWRATRPMDPRWGLGSFHSRHFRKGLYPTWHEYGAIFKAYISQQ